MCHVKGYLDTLSLDSLIFITIGYRDPPFGISDDATNKATGKVPASIIDAYSDIVR